MFKIGDLVEVDEEFAFRVHPSGRSSHLGLIMEIFEGVSHPLLRDAEIPISLLPIYKIRLGFGAILLSHIYISRVKIK